MSGKKHGLLVAISMTLWYFGQSNYYKKLAIKSVIDSENVGWEYIMDLRFEKAWRNECVPPKIWSSEDIQLKE